MDNDSGLLDFKTTEEVHEYMENLGLQFEYGCEKEKNPVSCHSLAQWFENFKRMHWKSAEILHDNCFQRDFGDSCFQYASFKLIGKPNVLRDSLEAFRALEHGCRRSKQARCCHGAGRLVAEGVASHAPNLSAALPLFKQGCHLGSAESCFHLGGAAMMLAHKEDEDARTHNKETNVDAMEFRTLAFKSWIDCCNLGHELCCRNIAKMYSDGDGVKKSEKKANEFKMKADDLAATRRKNEQFIQEPATTAA